MPRKIDVSFAKVPLLVKVAGELPTTARWGLTLDEARNLHRQLGVSIAEGEEYLKANPWAQAPADRADGKTKAAAV